MVSAASGCATASCSSRTAVAGSVARDAPFFTVSSAMHTSGDVS
ncbi:MAG: hypothetical protein R3F59_19745 [Myxococcota bacterium]